MGATPVSGRALLGAGAIGALVVAAAIFSVTEDLVFRITGAVIATFLVLVWIALPTRQDRSRDESAAQGPEALENYAVGETVIALGTFEHVGGASVGMVELNGEAWKARCSVSVPAAKDELIVVRRKGLTLDVRPRERTV